MRTIFFGKHIFSYCFTSIITSFTFVYSFLYLLCPFFILVSFVNCSFSSLTHSLFIFLFFLSSPLLSFKISLLLFSPIICFILFPSSTILFFFLFLVASIKIVIQQSRNSLSFLFSFSPYHHISFSPPRALHNYCHLHLPPFCTTIITSLFPSIRELFLILFTNLYSWICPWIFPFCSTFIADFFLIHA